MFVGSVVVLSAYVLATCFVHVWSQVPPRPAARLAPRLLVYDSSRFHHGTRHENHSTLGAPWAAMR